MFWKKKNRFQKVCDALNKIDTDCDRICILGKSYPTYVRADGLNSSKLKLDYAHTLTGAERAYAMKWIREQ